VPCGDEPDMSVISTCTALSRSVMEALSPASDTALFSMVTRVCESWCIVVAWVVSVAGDMLMCKYGPQFACCSGCPPVGRLAYVIRVVSE
jgi:hypothetical protein